jgi:hypothetical protein
MTAARGWIQKRAGICKAVAAGLAGASVAMAGPEGRAMPPARSRSRAGGDDDPGEAQVGIWGHEMLPQITAAVYR